MTHPGADQDVWVVGGDLPVSLDIDIGGGKTLADLYAELVTIAGGDTIAQVVAAIVAAQAATTIANFPADQKVHADNLDLATTALRDAILGVGAKTLSDIVTALGFSKNAGAADATTLRVVTASDGPTVAVLGATNDAAAGDATGSINAHLRALHTVLGAAADAAAGDATGSLNAHARQIAKLLAATLIVDTELGAAVALTSGQSSPSGPMVGAAPMLSRNGTTLDVQSSMANAADGITGIGYAAIGSIVGVTGTTYDKLRTPKVFKSLAAVSIASEATLWTPTSGKKFRLMGGLVSVGGGAGNVTIKDNTSGTTIATLPKAVLDDPFFFELGNGILSAAANNVLTGTGAGSSTISGTIWGCEE